MCAIEVLDSKKYLEKKLSGMGGVESGELPLMAIRAVDLTWEAYVLGAH